MKCFHMLSLLMLIVQMILKVPLGKTNHSPYVPTAICTHFHDNFYHSVLCEFFDMFVSSARITFSIKGQWCIVFEFSMPNSADP